MNMRQLDHPPGESTRRPPTATPSVLHLMQCTNLGGMEQVTVRLMNNLAARGATFRIATPRPFGPCADAMRRLDPDARDFTYRGRFGWRDFRRFRSHVRLLAEDCSHIWVTGTSAAALAAVKRLKQPKVLSHHYHHFEGLRPVSWLRWRAFYEVLCRDLDAVTYPTAFTRNEAMRIAPWLAAKAHVVRNGIDVHYVDETTRLARRAAARAQLGLPQDAFIIGNAGWLIRRKRHDVFLRVAAQVKRQIPEGFFILCGSGDEERALRELAARLGIADAVHFTGWVPDLTLHYRAWDALLFNTDFDTLPATPMEAASEGCVVVASQVYSGLGEMIEHGHTGYLFPTHDITALAGALIALHRDAKTAERLRAAAISKLQAEFSPALAVGFFTRFFQLGRLVS